MLILNLFGEIGNSFSLDWYLQFWKKYLEQRNKIKQNWAEVENFDKCFCVIFERCDKFSISGKIERYFCKIS